MAKRAARSCQVFWERQGQRWLAAFGAAAVFSVVLGVVGLSSGLADSPPPTSGAPSSVTLPTFTDSSCGMHPRQEPSAWTPYNFIIPNAQFYKDEGYKLQAEVTNSTPPYSGGAPSFLVATDSYAYLLSGQTNWGWQTISFTSPTVPLSFQVDDTGFLSSCTFAPITVAFRWVPASYTPPPPPSSAFGGCNAAVPGACTSLQSAGVPQTARTAILRRPRPMRGSGRTGRRLAFTRTYDSTMAQAEARVGSPGPLGYGWTDNWNMSLVLNQPVPNDVYGMTGSPSGGAGHTGDTGPAGSALLNGPQGVAVDASGNVYIADTGNNRVQEVAASTHTQWGISMYFAGDVYTVAGDANGSAGQSGNGGLATSALLSGPQGVTVDAAGNLYIADTANNRIQEVAATTHTQWGISLTANDIYTIAGSATGSCGHSGNGGLATSALLCGPTTVVLELRQVT